ncbi:hypothetical protein RB595_003456 [Gaeumannomyces hyphopodioides]
MGRKTMGSLWAVLQDSQTHSNDARSMRSVRLTGSASVCPLQGLQHGSTWLGHQAELRTSGNNMPPRVTEYPETLVVPPRQLPHKQTFIVLHGRGSWADKFGPALLETAVSAPPSSSGPVSPPQTLASIFPHAKFVFPTAPHTRATIYGRSLTHQWFNNWKLDPPATEREDLQVPGLRDTAAYLHSLIRDEVAATPGADARSVVLVGLSQGCAASLVSLLLWEGPALGAVVGMCGWLPFCERIREQLDEGAGGEDNLFQREDEDQEKEPARVAVDWLREELGLPSEGIRGDAGLVFRKVPVFLGHGVEDDRVHVSLGRDAAGLLRNLGANAIYKEYKTLGHWYSGDMLGDIVDFVFESTGWGKMET